MADELKSQVDASPKEPPAEGQAQETSNEQPQSKEPKKEEKSVNLFELDEFKAYQAQQNRTLSEMQRKVQAAEQKAREAAMKGMDDFEKVQYERDEMQRQLQEMHEQMELQRMRTQREADISEIMRETGAPREIIEAQGTVYDAWKAAAAYVKKSAGEQAKMLQQAEQEKSEANKPDVGGGKASTPTSRFDDKLKDDIKNKDAKGFILSYLTGDA